MQKNKVVVDTNILISAFVFDGDIEEIVKKIFSFSEIYVSPELLKEYRETPMKLESEGKIDSYQLEILIAGIAAFVSNSKLVILKKKLSICRDSEDNMLLECCLVSKADFLVTGDKDLLEIAPFCLPQGLHNLKILTPHQFLKLLY